MVPSGTVDSVVAHVDSLNASAAKVNKALFGRSAREESSDDEDEDEEEEEESASSKGLIGLSAEQNVSACLVEVRAS